MFKEFLLHPLKLLIIIRVFKNGGLRAILFGQKKTHSQILVINFNVFR